ncbi:MAG: hypothetical protein ACFFCO_12990 [Promethearchaeota archaeon]
MSYTYKETKEELIIDKGIATREMWKSYDHGQEHVSYEALERGVKIRNRVPLVLDTVHDHARPLTNAAKALGYADLRPCPEKRGLTVTWHFLKDKCPASLLDSIRRKEPLPVSIYQYTNVEDDEQEDLLFDHIAILEESIPRCPVERCGVGVYDGKMTEKETEVEAPEPPAEAVQEPVPTVPEKESKEPEAKEPVQQPPELPAEDLKDQELEKLKAQVKEIRDPLVDELVAKGYERQKLNPLDVPTLQLMVTHARASVTQSLPGTVPQPAPEKPKSLDERVDDVYKEAKERSVKAGKERWKDW